MKKEKLFAINIVCIFVFTLAGCNAGIVNDPMSAINFIDGDTERIIGVLKPFPQKTENIQVTMNKFREAFYGATILSIEAVVDLYAAVDDRENAEKMEQLLKDLEKAKVENDETEMKRIYQQINNAYDSVKDINLEKDATNERARDLLWHASLKTSVAIWLDNKAYQYAGTLVEEIPNEIKSDPINLRTYSSTLSLSQMALNALPIQIENTGRISLKIAEYSTKNGLNEPTKAQKEKLLKENAPALSDEDYDDL